MVRTLQTLVRDLGRHGDRAAIVAFTPAGREEWSYRRLHDTVWRLTAGLVSRGYGPKARVAVISANSPAVIVLRLALAAAGCVAVPFDDMISPAELDRAIADSGARALFISHEVAQRVTPDVEAVYLLDGDDASWTALMADAAPADWPDLKPDDVTALVYTSGTTGTAKGVPLSHENFLINVDALSAGGFIDARDNTLLPIPLHHAYPYMAGLLVPLACGATIVLPRGVTGGDIAEALSQARVTAMVGVPRLYEAMADGITARIAAGGAFTRLVFGGLLALSIAARRRLGLRLGRLLMMPVRARFAPALRLLASGGARLEDKVAWTLEGLGFEVLSGYGLVETASVTTYNRHGRGRIGCEGLPVEGAEIRIDRPDVDGIGEIQIRGPHVFAGYHDNPEATAEAFAAEGWFRTGDLGHLEADGALVVVGRSKEIIVLAGGKNVGPEEIEDALTSSGFIEDAAVLEVDGDLHALVVPDMAALRDVATGRLDEVIRVAVIESCVELAPYKRVTGFRLWRQPFPRTRLGKIRRFALPAIYADAERAASRAPDEYDENDLALLARPEAARALELIRRRFAGVPVHLDTSPQLDLGVDSLAWLEIAQELEAEIGIAIPVETVAEIVTIRELIRAVTSREPSVSHVAPSPAKSWTLQKHGPGMRAFAFLMYGLNRLVMRGLFRVKVRGEWPESDGPVLFVVNHASDIDSFITAAAMPWRVARETWWSGEVTRVFSTPLRRWFARAGQVLPIDDRRPAESLEHARSILARDGHLVWFPEAWRTPDGRLQPFMRGVGILVNEERPRVCPVWLEGTFEVLPRHRRLPRIRPVTLILGPAIPGDDLAVGPDSADPAADVAAAIRAHVARLEPCDRDEE